MDLLSKPMTEVNGMKAGVEEIDAQYEMYIKIDRFYCHPVQQKAHVAINDFKIACRTSKVCSYGNTLIQLKTVRKG